MGPEALHFVVVTLILTWIAIALGFWLARERVHVPFRDTPTKFLEREGWRIRYTRAGRGPAMVLLHGIGANLYCWRTLIPFLKNKYTVIALDLPGFGQSSKPTDVKYGLDEQTERLDWIFNELGLSQIYLVGNSMGGNIALWYALEYPARVQGLAVIAPATSPKLFPIEAAKWAWLALPASLLTSRTAMRLAHRRTVSKKHLVDADRVEETFKTYGGQPAATRAFMLASEVIRDRRIGQRLAQLAKPLLILWGSQDKLVNRKVIDELEAAVKDHESFVHIGGGHHLQEDEPEWVAEKIDTFFSTARR